MVSDDTTDESVSEAEVSQVRRQFLKGIGAGSLGFIAGCGGDGGETTPTASPTDSPTDTEADDPTDTEADDGGGGDEDEPTATETEAAPDRKDQTYRLGRSTVDLSKATNWNPYDEKQTGWWGQNMMWSVMGETSILTYNWIESGATWEAGDGSVAITLQDDWQWSDGNEVTASDLATQYRLGKYMAGHRAWETFESVNVVDEKTFEFTGAENVRGELLLPNVLGANERVRSPERWNTKWLEQFQDAQSDYSVDDELNDAASEIRNNLLQKEIPFSKDVAVTSGPFVIETRRAQELTFVPHEGHFNSDKINFNELKLKSADTLDIFRQAILNDKVDYAWGTPTPGVEKQLQNNSDIQVSTGPGRPWSIVGMMPNFEHKHFGKRKVRQAFYHLVDRTQMPQLAWGTGWTAAPNGHTFASQDQVNNQFPDLGPKLNRYTVGDTEASKEAAGSLLKDAGFSKQGGAWVTPEGNEWTIEITSPSWGFATGTADAVATILKRQGFNASTTVLEGGAMITRWDNADFAVSPSAFGGNSAGTGGIPFITMKNSFFGFRGQDSPWNHVPDTLEIPFPVGDPDGDLQEYNWKEDRQKLKSATGEEYQTAWRRLTWACNQTLPSFPTHFSTFFRWYRTDDWDWPDRPGSDLHGYQNFGRSILHHGWPKAK